MMPSANEEAFFALVCLGIGHQVYVLPNDINWSAVRDIATRHGLSAVVIDGIERVPESLRPPKEQLLEWIGEVLQSYEYRYTQYRSAIAELAGFYNSHGLKMMVLKGYACSLDWPKPEHRPCGDIDIWQFGEQKTGDELLKREKGINVDMSHHHHSVFYWRDFMVENHYDFINTKDLKSSKMLEIIFKELGTDDSCFVDLFGE